MNQILTFFQALFYIVPVCVVSLIINSPKWFELELKDMVFDEELGLMPATENSTEIITIVAGTWLRYNQNYVNYYMHWTLFLLTGVVPLGALFFLNLRIYLRLKSVRQIRSNTRLENVSRLWQIGFYVAAN